MASLFFSYSHKDEVLRDQLEVHLTMLKRQGIISAWHDRRIVAGEDIDDAISGYLEEADVVLLLVSSDFLASDYCYEREMNRAMERQREGSTEVIPVILRPCDWHSAPFGRLNALPLEGKPVTKWADADDAFLNIVEGIKAALKNIHGDKSVSIVDDVRIHASKPSPSSEGPRSSNLRIKKEFAERDRDQFLHEGFEFIARFFENSLEELSRRNPRIEGSFRRIDANRFTAVVYRDGKTVSQCAIFIGGHFGSSGGIAYSSNSYAGDNGFNESLNVANDGQAMHFESLGMHSFGKRDEKLSMQGAAELYWSMLIRTLQD